MGLEVRDGSGRQNDLLFVVVFFFGLYTLRACVVLPSFFDGPRTKIDVGNSVPAGRRTRSMLCNF